MKDTDTDTDLSIACCSEKGEQSLCGAGLGRLTTDGAQHTRIP